MKVSFEEKKRYNKQIETAFSYGYRMGADFYADYLKQNEKGKRSIKQLQDDMHRDAKKGDSFAKGFMCATRDAANDRKSKRRGK